MASRRVTRRTALKAGLLAGAAPYVLGSARLTASDRPAANDRFALAAIGVRGRGDRLMRWAMGNNAVEMVAVCDVDRGVLSKAVEKVRRHHASRGRQRAGVQACADFREVLARDDVDGVILGTPDHWHVPMAIAAVEAGKDVYVEKPMSLTIGEGRALAEAVARTRRMVQVGSQQRSDGKFRLACELVRSGRIGKVRKVEVGIPTRSGSVRSWSPMPVPNGFDYEMWLGPAPREPYHKSRCHYNFRFVTDYSGGDVTNWGAHYLDIAQWGLDADASGPSAVRGRGRRHVGALHDCFFDIDVHYDFPNGVDLHLRTGGGGTKFIGDDGWVFVNRGKIETQPAWLVREGIGAGDVLLRRSRGGHMEGWLAAMRTRDETELVAPVEVGHRTATLCHLANVAMELGRELRWDPREERFETDTQANRMRSRPARAPWGA